MGQYVNQANSYSRSANKIIEALNNYVKEFKNASEIIASFDKSDYLNSYVEAEITEILKIISEVIGDYENKKGLVYNKAVAIDERIAREEAERRRREEEARKKKEEEESAKEE